MREFLSQNEIAFEYHNVDDEPEAMEALLARGFMSTPVTLIDDQAVTGFDRGRLSALLGIEASDP